MSKADAGNKVMSPTTSLKKGTGTQLTATATNEEVEEEKRKLVLDNTKLDDFIFLGKYTLFVCLFSQLMILCQLGNMLYMVYAGYF